MIIWLITYIRNSFTEEVLWLYQIQVLKLKNGNEVLKLILDFLIKKFLDILIREMQILQNLLVMIIILTYLLNCVQSGYPCEFNHFFLVILWNVVVYHCAAMENKCSVSVDDHLVHLSTISFSIEKSLFIVFNRVHSLKPTFLT